MSRQLSSFAGPVAAFAVSFVTFQWAYGYVIGFQRDTNDCFFLFGHGFLLEFLDRPAGPLRYAGRFLGQFYHHERLGAAIVAGCIACFGALFHRVLTKLDENASFLRASFACVLLLALHMSPLCLVHDTLGLCASCGAFFGYLSMPGTRIRRFYAVLVTPIAYLALGFYAWFFVIWVALFEWLDGPLRSGLPFKIGYVVFAATVPLAAWRWLFSISLRGAWTCPLMIGPPFRTGSPYQTSRQLAADVLLAVASSVLLLSMPFWGRLFARKRFGRLRRMAFGGRRRVAWGMATFAVAALFGWLRYDAPLATLVDCHRLYRQRQWSSLLERARRNPFGDLRVQFMTNFALCHQGRLLDAMFGYPQSWGTRGLVLNYSGRPGLSELEDDTAKGMYNSDLYFEMGLINAALRHAYNAMAIQGETYDTIRRMAECSMVNGNHAMAAKYLTLLEKTLFHREFARRWKAILADPRATWRELADVRKRLPTVDGDVLRHPSVPFLLLLEARPDNRMAIDYLMAWLLLDKSERSLASIGCREGIRQLQNAGYASIPTHCQEALWLWQRLGRPPVDLQGFDYDEATTARVDAFLSDPALRLGGQAALEHARTRYGDTYLFYYFFVSPPTSGVLERPGRYEGTPREE